MSKHVLLVEDEKILAKNIAFFLEKEAYKVEVAHDGQSGLELFQKHSYDLLLLDWSLPKLDGLELCKIARKTSNVPIIMITAKSEVMDKVIGLEVGADDYIVKPFHQRELLARMHALFRRNQQQQQTDRVIHYDSIILDKDKMTLGFENEKIHLTTTEYKLLELMIRHPENVYTRDYLFDQIWGNTMIGHDRTVDVSISRLRKRLEELTGKRYLHAVRGSGYRLNSPDEN